MAQLRNLDRAIIDDRKFTEYALSETNNTGRHKALVFEHVLGYTVEKWQELKSAILEGVKAVDAVEVASDLGERYAVDVEIMGPSGRSATVRTIWQYDRQRDGTTAEAPRLLTLFVRKRRN